MRSDVLNENSSSYGKQYQLENVELVSAAKTLSLSDSGKTFMVESSGGAYEITLPPATQNQPGWNAKFVVQEKTPTGDITIAAGSAIINIVSKDAGSDLASSTAGTEVSNIILDTTAQRGDVVELMYDLNGQYVGTAFSGINNGIQTS